MSYLHWAYRNGGQLLSRFLGLDGGLIGSLVRRRSGRGKVTAEECKPPSAAASSRGSTPPPGSERAISGGCRCPETENHYGAGAHIQSESGKAWYIFKQDCPLHGEGNWLDLAKGEN